MHDMEWIPQQKSSEKFNEEVETSIFINTTSVTNETGPELARKFISLATHESVHKMVKLQIFTEIWKELKADVTYRYEIRKITEMMLFDCIKQEFDMLSVTLFKQLLDIKMEVKRLREDLNEKLLNNNPWSSKYSALIGNKNSISTKQSMENILTGSEQSIPIKSAESILTENENSIPTESKQNISTKSTENIPTGNENNIPTESKKSIATNSAENIPTESEQSIATNSAENIPTESKKNILTEIVKSISIGSEKKNKKKEENKKEERRKEEKTGKMKVRS